jgi:hypothetical protein
VLHIKIVNERDIMSLPRDLVQKIIEWSSPSIDTQLAFKIRPKKIDESRAWRLWYLLKSHDGIIYNLETESLHILRMPGAYAVRRPIKLDWVQEGMWCFNADGLEHTLEMATASGGFIMVPSNLPWLTELRVLLRGSGLARVIGAATGSTF